MPMYSAWAWEKDARDVRGDTDRSHTSGFPYAPPDAPDITNGRTVEFDKQKKLHIDKLREKLKALKVELADKSLKDAAAKALKDAAAKTLKDADAKAAVVDVDLHVSLNPESDEDSLFAKSSDAEDEKEIDKNGQHHDTASSDDSSDAQEKGEDAKAVQMTDAASQDASSYDEDSSDEEMGSQADDGRSSSTIVVSDLPMHEKWFLATLIRLRVVGVLFLLALPQFLRFKKAVFSMDHIFISLPAVFIVKNKFVLNICEFIIVKTIVFEHMYSKAFAFLTGS